MGWLLAMLSGCVPAQAIPFTEVPFTGSPTGTPFRFPATWTPEPPPSTATATQTPLPSVTPSPSLTPTPTGSEGTYTPPEFVVALATQMGQKPSPTPMQDCVAIATQPGITLTRGPIESHQSPGLSSMEINTAYTIEAWLHPNLYLSLNGEIQGWANVLSIGLTLSGANCDPPTQTEVTDYFGFPYVCIFIAVGGSAPPVMYLEPSFNAETLFQNPIGHILNHEDDFYFVTAGNSGPSGYISKQAGQAVGDCEHILGAQP